MLKFFLSLYVVCFLVINNFSLLDSSYETIKKAQVSRSLEASSTYESIRDDNIDMYNEWKHLNHMGAYLGTKLLEEFPPDYAYNKFLGKQMKYCEDNNLVPAHCVSFAFGKEEYKDLNRGTDVNRLCISDQIGDIE